MELLVYLVLFGGAFLLGILVLRIVGAWMLRIDVVIKNQEKTIKYLHHIAKKADDLRDGKVES